MSTGLTALILGSTGEVGRHALVNALQHAGYAKVYEAGRKSATTLEPTRNFMLPQSHPKLQPFIALDFEKLVDGDKGEADKLAATQADAVIIALGTTKAVAGSMEKFVRIDKDYVVAAAKAARLETKNQSLVYCSSGGADPKSTFPYLKSKGETEIALLRIGYSRTTFTRPGMLVAPDGRNKFRLVESVASKVTGALSRFTDALEIKTPLVGLVIANTGLGTAPWTTDGTKDDPLPCGGHGIFEHPIPDGKVWCIANSGLLKYAKQLQTGTAAPAIASKPPPPPAARPSEAVLPATPAVAETAAVTPAAAPSAEVAATPAPAVEASKPAEVAATAPATATEPAKVAEPEAAAPVAATATPAVAEPVAAEPAAAAPVETKPVAATTEAATSTTEPAKPAA